MEAKWETRHQDHEIYLGVQDSIKMLIVNAYEPCWLEEIEDDVVELTQKTAFKFLEHLITQCLKITNREKKMKIKNTESPWLVDEDVTVYFAKLEK